MSSLETRVKRLEDSAPVGDPRDALTVKLDFDAVRRHLRRHLLRQDVFDIEALTLRIARHAQT